MRASALRCKAGLRDAERQRAQHFAEHADNGEAPPRRDGIIQGHLCCEWDRGSELTKRDGERV
eukprot:2156368-Lingulodinium_polyedra.AAC.1